MKILSDKSILLALETLKDWKYEKKRLHKTFTFADFVGAFSFMTRVALCAERNDHHPDWSNSYRTVEIMLTTHSEGGVTEKDIALATTIDSLV